MTDEDAGRGQPGGIVSGVLFVAAVGLFAFVLWRTVGPTSSRGEWRTVSPDVRLEDLRLSGPGAKPGQVDHPALLYFHDPECEPCRSASRRFRQRLQRRTTKSPAVPVTDPTSYYVIGTPDTFVPDSAVSEYPGPVEVYVPVGSNPALGFVRDFPMFVATDSTGRVAKAYIGIPDREVFDRLEYAAQGPAGDR